MEESVCISSDSDPSSSPVLISGVDDDFEFPKASLSDICGRSSEDMSGRNEHSTKYESKGVGKPFETSSIGRESSDFLNNPGSSNSLPSEMKSNSCFPKTNSFHELSDSDSDCEAADIRSGMLGGTAVPETPVRDVECPGFGKPRAAALHESSFRDTHCLESDEPAGASPPDSPIRDVDREITNKRAVALHELSDSDSDQTLPPGSPKSVDGSSSKALGNCSRKCFTRGSDDDSPLLDNSGSNLNNPLSVNSCETLPPNESPVWILSDESTQPFTSSSGLPAADDGSDLFHSHSEPLLSTTYSISEFLTQPGANSEPLDLDNGSKPSRKRGPKSFEDILERKRLKALKEKEKAEKAAAAESLRRLRPGECLKYVTVVIDERIVSEYDWGPAVVRILELANAKHLVKMARDPCTVQWTRDQVGNATPVDESHIVFLWSIDKLLTSIQFGTFVDTFAKFKTKYPAHKLLLAVYGLHDYYKKQRKAEQRQKRSDESRDPNGPPARKRKTAYEITETQIEMELIALQVRLGISHKALNSPQDAAGFLQVTTKSVAELPFKLERERIDEERNWYAKGDSRNCVRVDKDFNGLRQLWLQQLAQFNNSGLDTAKAIAQIYPTPLSLYRAYSELTTLKEKEQMLQEIFVRRGSGCGGRRLGPELSRKISLMFCQDDDLPLG